LIFKFLDSTVSKNKRCLAIHNTMMEGTSSELDEALIQQFMLHWTDHVPILRNMIMTQVQIFCEELDLWHEYEYFQGSLHKLKLQHGISLHHVWIKTESADTEAGEKLSPQQLYNASELALILVVFLKDICTRNWGDTKLPSGFKEFKDSTTVLDCSNANWYTDHKGISRMVWEAFYSWH
jgi:hypothetical protein